MSRFLKPEAVRLMLSKGDWILVKKELTAGEQRRVFAKTTKGARAGEPIEIDLEKAGLTQMVEYLIDWSFTDEAGVQVSIRDMPAEYVSDMINSLDVDTYNEIRNAIDAHELSVTEEKKTRATVNVS